MTVVFSNTYTRTYFVEIHVSIDSAMCVKKGDSEKKDTNLLF